MSRRAYVPPIEIRVGQNRDYQNGIDRMACKHPGCKRWRVDGKTKYCADHEKVYPLEDKHFVNRVMESLAKEPT